MAIPGYINEYQTDYSSAEYHEELSPLVGILGNTNKDVGCSDIQRQENKQNQTRKR